MKRGTPDHPKTAALADLLGLELFAAVGLLEMLWHFTAAYSPRGDIGLWPDKRIAKALAWRRDPSKLVAALVESGWLDPDPTHRLLVHGWAEHADQGVARKLARSNQSFAVATTSQRLDTSSRQLDKDSLARAQAVAVPLPDASAVALPGPEPIARAGPAPTSGGHPTKPPNPLVNRPKLIAEGNGFIRAISEALDQDPTEVLGRASTGDGKFKGPPKVRLEDMTDDRLALTVRDLRREAAQVAASRARDAPPTPDIPATPEAETAWEGVREEIARRIGIPEVVRTLLAGMHGHHHEAERLVVRVPSDTSARMLRGHPKLADLWTRVELEVQPT